MAVIEKDRINTRYKELFTVKLLHSSYGTSHKSSIAEGMRIEPDELTEKLLINNNMGYRFLNDTLICFIRTGLFSPPAASPAVPFVKFGGTNIFRFLVFVSAAFLAKTNAEAAGAENVYHFTNQLNAGSDGCITMHTDGVNNDDLKQVINIKPARNCFAVIDIVSQGASATSYELFDNAASQQLKSPAFSILFKPKI